MNPSFVVPDLSTPPEPTSPGRNTGNRNQRPLANLKFQWYSEPYKKFELKITTEQDQNLVAILPPHPDSPDPKTGWFLRVPFFRIKETTKIGDRDVSDMVELPSLKVWGKQDPIAETIDRIYRTLGKNHPTIGQYRWMLPLHKYLFLVANGDPDLQNLQEYPEVLELPGDYRDLYPVDSKGGVLSEGRRLSILPHEKETLKTSPRYGTPRYGSNLINPAGQPIVEIERRGLRLDTRYTVRVPSDALIPLRKTSILDGIRPIRDILNMPDPSHHAELLRYKLSKEELEKFAPHLVNITVQGVDVPKPPPTRAPVTIDQPTPQPTAPTAHQTRPGPTEPSTAQIPPPNPQPAVATPTQAKAAAAATVANDPAPSSTETAPKTHPNGLIVVGEHQTIKLALPTDPTHAMAMLQALSQEEIRTFSSANVDARPFYNELLKCTDPEKVKAWNPQFIIGG